MTQNLSILAYDGCLASSVTGPMDLFNIANTLAALQTPRRRPLLAPIVCSVDGRPIRTSSGLRLETDRYALAKTDFLFLAALDHADVATLLQQLRTRHDVVETIGAAAQQGIPIAAACSGAFFLAESGALEGCKATTSWWLSALFRRRYPLVQLVPEQVVVQSRHFMTAGAVTSYFDLGLRIVARLGGADLARQLARVMLIDPRRQSQAPYVMSAMLERPREGVAEQAERWLQRHLQEEFAIEQLARHCGVSVRTLLRRFHSVHGTTPVRYVQRLRVERAKAMLETSLLSLDEIVERCGYQDTSAFRKLFKTVTQMTPREYQARFRLRPQ